MNALWWTARLTPLLVGLAGCHAGPLDAIELLPTTLGTGMVVHFPYDEGTGDLLLVHSGNARDGHKTGGTWITDGAFGGALHLEKGESVAVSPFPNATANYTVATWVRFAGETAATDRWETVLTTENTGGWELNIDRSTDTPGLHVAFWKGPLLGDYNYLTCACLKLGTWTHVAGVVDGEALTLSLYVDGILQGSTAVAQTIAPGYATLYAGRWQGEGRLFSGDIDDTVVYARALVPDEIADLQKHSPPDPR